MKQIISGQLHAVGSDDVSVGCKGEVSKRESILDYVAYHLALACGQTASETS